MQENVINSEGKTDFMKVKDLEVKLSFVGKFTPNQLINILNFDITQIMNIINNDVNNTSPLIEINNDDFRLIFKINNQKRSISSIVVRYRIGYVNRISVYLTFEKKDDKGNIISPFSLKIKFRKNEISIPIELFQMFKKEFKYYNISDLRIADSEPQRRFIEFLYHHGMTELEDLLHIDDNIY